MSKVDDELTRRLHRAERPVDVNALFEGLERRRSHRERVRRVQTALLAFAVLAATAGGFVFLRHAFDPDKRDVGDAQTPSVANGEIVFSRASSEGDHLFLIKPDGTDLRQITDGNTGDRLPAWSPDGSRIVFVRKAESSMRLYVLDVDSGDMRPITPPTMGVYRPSWSPDGDLIAFAGVGENVSDIWVVRPDGSGLQRITDGEFFAPDAPRWSPDGSTIAFSANLINEDDYREGWDVYAIGKDGSGLRNLSDTPNPEQSEAPIGWLADGNLLLSESPGKIEAGPGLPIQMGRWLEVTPSGDFVRTVLEAAVNTPDHLQEPRLSPDGRFVVFDSARGGMQEVWFVDVENLEFTQVTTGGGYGAAWQPVPAGSETEPSPTSEPTVSPSPEPAGRDIGLGFNLCNDERLGGIDFLGDGTTGTAWIGVPTNDDGTCPGNSRPGRYVVAEDHTEDGVADSWLDLPWQCYVDCVPFDATDLDANGTEELVVASYFSIMDYYVMALKPDANGALRIAPLLVAEPGHAPADLIAGEPLRIDAGGDAGYGSVIWCDNYPDDPVIVWAWVLGVVDGNQPSEVHITRLQVQSDGMVHIVGTNDYTISATENWGYGNRTAPACGVDFHPNA